ncbi:dTMP kinase [Nocardia blacklockiae]|uniref:dTMP kinase n=1 Tax=Nocardia blacklockiae TaxID=480036 RepID=UPI001892F72C|nr:hypothetical protein [Nocardia blacklockiae]MBF6171109.1 hypothetical protein [Nocardia blacklockiae]
MYRKFVTFEGYDGSGKSTLIETVRTRLSEKDIRVVGRKAEPELLGISRVVEREDLRPHPEVELLLRISLEAERKYVIEQALLDHDMVICDRAVISLLSWFGYLQVEREQFEPLLQKLVDYHRNSVTIVCNADFDTCWSRIGDKSSKSWKERQGVDANRRYFGMYEESIRLYKDAEADLVFVDTAGLSVDESAAQIVDALVSRGVC